MEDTNKFDFDLPEPTEVEIQETISKVKTKEGVTLTLKDAMDYTKLYEELRQWFLIEKNLESPDSISSKVVKEMKNRLKNGLKTKQTQDMSEKSLSVVIQKEKQRISSGIRAIVAKYK